ncbi:phage-related conserved hypothetical protein [Bordetella bronchiseptica RB50]|uniref:DUF1833 domain-containing protein n=4 Tax=Bordetella bronchiseptica TaxID=518 RepID=A0A0H3LMU8_BORBR|nr:phage-related conserved hypothetical protein [Bordetella bronchiseptica RB50]CCJ51953.1 phage-related conserved hypothetical protein [Bordetella bronchiseptica 253]CCN17189.1 phage-related conserved hypothetical protein [Bordetella bronchiseptica MO211]CCN24114.1 phage-related conserved hypothetical protein [Bordetella bronchiseptica 1289]BAO70045.1 hypothetical protein BBS798_3320 [Bordetella bronchiseptica]
MPEWRCSLSRCIYILSRAFVMSLEQALKEAYASAPQDRVVFDTLELRHPAFVDPHGEPTAVRVVLGYEDIRARLETEAPLDGGQDVMFQAGAFRFRLPGFEEGQVPSLLIAIDGASEQIVDHVEAAVQSRFPIYVTYRPYLSTDLSMPQMNPPITMELNKVTVTGSSVSGTATLSDVHNWAFPHERYVRERFPGLFR